MYYTISHTELSHILFGSKKVAGTDKPNIKEEKSISHEEEAGIMLIKSMSLSKTVS